MSEVDRSRYLNVTRESVAAAEETAKKFMGGPMRLTKGNRYYLRFMPAFKLNAAGIPQWWSYGMRHFGIPVIGKEDGKKITMDCPQSIGARCIPCENKAVFKMMGAWDDFKGCSPRKRTYFNVIDIQNLDAGVQVLEDGPKLWQLLREEFEEENDQLFDPYTGSVLIVIVKDADPWRKLKYPESHQCSLDEIDENALTWALPENLNDLDEQWDFPTLEWQQETFAYLLGGGPTQIAAPTPQQQIEAPAPAPAAPVSVGVAAILEGDDGVIEGEIVEEAQPAPAPAAVIAEANEVVQAPPAVAPAAVLAEAQAAANPAPGDGAPTPTPAAVPAANAGSAVLADYKDGMAEKDNDETEMPD